jgi:adenine-specific DNA glycosylase
VLARLGAVHGDLRNGKRWSKLQQTADALLAPGATGDWNQAMMELGATLCTPRSPQCLLCPVGEFCEARKQGLAEVLPEKRRKRANEEITLAALVLMDPRGRTLLFSPPKADDTSDVTTLLSRMWHFPTIRVQSNAETELRSYAAGLFAGGRIRGKFAALTRVRHTVTYRQITVQPFALRVAQLPRVEQAKAVPLSDLSSLPVSNLTRKVARAALETRTEASSGLKVASLPGAMLELKLPTTKL